MSKFKWDDFYLSSAAMVVGFLSSVGAGVYGLATDDTTALSSAVILSWLAMAALVLALKSAGENHGRENNRPL